MCNLHVKERQVPPDPLLPVHKVMFQEEFSLILAKDLVLQLVLLQGLLLHLLTLRVQGEWLNAALHHPTLAPALGKQVLTYLLTESLQVIMEKLPFCTLLNALFPYEPQHGK